MVSEALL